MPVRVRRLVSVFARDDTVSIRQLAPARTMPGFPLVLIVSFADGVSMPVRVRRLVSVSRDDTVSIRQLALARTMPGFPLVLIVSFADVRVAGCRRAGQAATRVPPGARCPAPGIVAVVLWKACRVLCADAAAACADLAGGLLACPSCGTGRLARWGHGRDRVIRLLNGATARLRPDRARCRSCRRTHILLPSWCAPRRADAIEVIGTGLAAALGGAGYVRIGVDLGVPAGTVRGWLRRIRGRAEEMRCFAIFQLGAIGGTGPALPGPDASPLHDALNAVAAAAHAALTGYGLDRADLWPLLGRFGLARHLAPARAG